MLITEFMHSHIQMLFGQKWTAQTRGTNTESARRDLDLLCWLVDVDSQSIYNISSVPNSAGKYFSTETIKTLFHHDWCCVNFTHLKVRPPCHATITTLPELSQIPQ